MVFRPNDLSHYLIASGSGSGSGSVRIGVPEIERCLIVGGVAKVNQGISVNLSARMIPLQLIPLLGTAIIVNSIGRVSEHHVRTLPGHQRNYVDLGGTIPAHYPVRPACGRFARD